MNAKSANQAHQIRFWLMLFCLSSLSQPTAHAALLALNPSHCEAIIEGDSAFRSHLIRTIENIQTLRDFWQKFLIDSSRISQTKRIVTGLGLGYKSISRAKYKKDNGDVADVFIKIQDIEASLNGKEFSGTRNFNTVRNEAKWAWVFDQLGFGPKFFGAYPTPQGRIALVYEYIEGMHVGTNDRYPFVPESRQRRVIEQLEKICRTLVELKIGSSNMQLRVLKDGTPYLIDSEFFTLKKTPDNLSVIEAEKSGAKIYLLTEDPRKIIAAYIQSIEDQIFIDD